jgi:hypothetical protein
MLAGLVAIHQPSTLQAQAAPAPLPYLSVEPAMNQLTAVNETFTVSIVAHNINASSQLVGIEFRLSYDPSLLQIVAVNNGSFLEPFAGAPNQGVFYLGPSYGTNYVMRGGFIAPDPDAIWHAPFPSGNGTIATITFKVIYEPPAGETAECDLTLFGTRLVDNAVQIIANDAISGHFEIAVPTLIGDLNFDGIVDIFDALVLANAFGSSPGDPHWNILADINHDGTVDIYDAILLANHFGETG